MNWNERMKEWNGMDSIIQKSKSANQNVKCGGIIKYSVHVFCYTNWKTLDE